MTLQEALAKVVEDLTQAGIDAPQDEAKRLWALAFPRKYPDYQEALDGTAVSRFLTYAERRANREPFSHISGRRAFWKHMFRVTPDVLDPRPDTETIVELALSKPFANVLDLGTGSGCILISLLAERPEARGVGTDISPEAVLIAGENAEMAGVADRLILPQSDWFDDVGGRYDLIVSNPPYISADEMAGLSPEVREFEPHVALTDYADGLSAYRRIAAGALNHLTPGGRLLVEIGWMQAEPVSELLRSADLQEVTVHRDLDDRPRVVSAYATAASVT